LIDVNYYNSDTTILSVDKIKPNSYLLILIPLFCFTLTTGCSESSSSNEIASTNSPMVTDSPLSPGSGIKAGYLDTTFGVKFFGNELFTANILVGENIFLGGYLNSGNNTLFSVGKFSISGTVDSSFGSTNGTVQTSVGAGQSNVSNFAVQSDLKLIAAGSFTPLVPIGKIALVRYNQDGSVDNTYGTQGKVLIDYSTSYLSISKVLVQPDEKTVVVGDVYYSGFSTTASFFLTRFKNDGTPDYSFGNSSMVTTSFASNSRDYPRDATIQSDGKIIVIGASNGPSFGPCIVARYLSDGSLDTTFGQSGKMFLKIPDTFSFFCKHVAAQTDGKIVVAGYGDSALGRSIQIVRLAANGTFDTTFAGGSGFVLGGAGDKVSEYDNESSSMLIQPDGKIVVAGIKSPTSSNSTVFLMRYNIDRTIDSKFGVSGISNNLKTGRIYYANLFLTSDSKLAIVGKDNVFGSFIFKVGM
jgi:uncharacterized delta-60 repeat protein